MDATSSHHREIGSVDSPELRRNPCAPFITRLARIGRLRVRCVKWACRLEGGQLYSQTARRILFDHHGVDVGAYSYGECLTPGAFPAGVSVGRYVSTATGVRIFLRNHPMDRLSMHPCFYNQRLGLVSEDNIDTSALTIDHDAWIGERAIITPGCQRIGLGAVVGAGAVVTKNVPDFAVFAGNPAKLIRYRFDEPIRQLIHDSQWWENAVEDCAKHMPAMTESLGNDAWQHPLLAHHSDQKIEGLERRRCA